MHVHETIMHVHAPLSGLGSPHSATHHPTLTFLFSPMQDELKELKQLLGSKIDYGNRLLSLDLVPRDENGVPVNPKTAGVMQLYKLVCEN